MFTKGAWLARQASGTLGQIIAPVTVALGGGMVFLLAPLVVGTLRSSGVGFTENQVGLIGSADPAGLFLGAVIGLRAIGRVNRRTLAVSALALATGANLWSMAGLMHPFQVLAACRLLAGTASGLALAVAYSCFSATTLPDRTFAIYLVSQTVVGGLIISVLAHWSLPGSIDSIFGAAAGLSSLGIAGALALPSASATPCVRTQATRGLGSLKLLTISSELLFAASCLAIWANFVAFGNTSGLTATEIAFALTAGLLGGAGGGIAVAFGGLRFGRVGPTALMLTMLIGSTLALNMHLTPGRFALAAFLFQFGINASIYVFGVVSAASPEGGLAVHYLLALKSGFALGPWLGSHIIQVGGLPWLVRSAAIALIAVSCLFAAILLSFTPTTQVSQERY